MKVKYAASFDTTVLEKRTYEVRRNDATLCTHDVLCDLEAMVFNGRLQRVGCEKNTGYKYICLLFDNIPRSFLGTPSRIRIRFGFPFKSICPDLPEIYSLVTMSNLPR